MYAHGIAAMRLHLSKKNDPLLNYMYYIEYFDFVMKKVNHN